MAVTGLILKECIPGKAVAMAVGMQAYIIFKFILRKISYGKYS